MWIKNGYQMRLKKMPEEAASRCVPYPSNDDQFDGCHPCLPSGFVTRAKKVPITLLRMLPGSRNHRSFQTPVPEM
jgi:hypothetical protein